MAAKYKVVVKNGDYGYNKNGEYGVKDYVHETSDLSSALRIFFDYVSDDSYEADEISKVTLSFNPKKKKREK